MATSETEPIWGLGVISGFGVIGRLTITIIIDFRPTSRAVELGGRG